MSILFKYTGLSLGRKVEGTLMAGNKKQLLAQLRQKQIFPTQVRALTQWHNRFQRPSNQAIYLLSKKLSTMLNAGLPLLASFELVTEQTKNSLLKQALYLISQQLKSGTSLSQALSQYPHIFDGTYIGLVKAGELSGQLPLFFKQIVDLYQRKTALQTAIKKALFYPTILLIVTVLIGLFMLIKVVPTFETIYANMQADLPALTQSVIALRQGVMTPFYWFVFMTIVLLIFLVSRLGQRVKIVQYFFHQCTLKLPVLGRLNQQLITAKTMLLMAHLLTAKIALLDALTLTQSLSKNIFFHRAMDQIKKQLLAGQTLSSTFADASFFPKHISQLLVVGERSGRLDEMFFTLANYYQEIFENKVARLTTLIEPLMILLVGALIGVLMLALYLPIFSAGHLLV